MSISVEHHIGPTRWPILALCICGWLSSIAIWYVGASRDDVYGFVYLWAGIFMITGTFWTFRATRQLADDRFCDAHGPAPIEYRSVHEYGRVLIRVTYSLSRPLPVLFAACIFSFHVVVVTVKSAQASGGPVALALVIPAVVSILTATGMTWWIKHSLWLLDLLGFKKRGGVKASEPASASP